MKNYFKFITNDEIAENEVLLYPITSEDVYSSLGKKLDEKYLYRIFIALSSADDLREKISSVINEATKLAFDDAEPAWQEIDEDYKEKI